MDADNPYDQGYFDSCMREDCNGVSEVERKEAQNFDSCMREDCNSKYAQISAPISVYSYDFLF